LLVECRKQLEGRKDLHGVRLARLEVLSDQPGLPEGLWVQLLDRALVLLLAHPLVPL